MLSKILKRLFKNRFTTAITLLILIGGYFGYQAISGDDEAVRYTVAAVEKGTLIVLVSGSGQVTVLDQIDVKPKVSGDVTAIYIYKDEYVKAGQLLAILDSRDIERSVRDAQNALDKAQRDLDEVKENYGDIEIDAERSLATAYKDGYSAVSTTFFKLSDYMKDLKDVSGTEHNEKEYIRGYELVLGKNSLFIQKLLDDYEEASDLYNKNFAFFRTVFQNDNRNTIYQLISDTIDTIEAISQALESARHMYDAVVMNEAHQNFTIASQIDKMQPKIESDVSAVYSNISSIQRIKDTIDDTNKDTPRNIENAQLAIENAQDNFLQKEEALSDAKEKLDEYNIYAPFSSIVASVNDKIKIGDTVSSGAVLATLITKQKIAEITLNEIDVAKVKVGQKATLTFDALPDISIPGKIIEVDMIGEVSQGVVSYGVKIAFNVNEEMIKPGMSVTADIIAEEKQDILVLPNSSVKFKKDFYYVEFVEADEEFGQQLLANISGTILPESLKLQIVEIGLSNDLFTEITNGLEEGDIVVVSTTNQDLEIQKATEAQGFQMMKMRSFSR